MRGSKYLPGKRKLGLRVGMAAAALGALTANAGATDPDKSADRTPTTTPIKHVIVVIAENSSFDHGFATFRPRDGQHIRNLLSRGIVNADGTPGPNFSKAAQFTVSPQPNYFISAPAGTKTAYTTLPPPDLNRVPQHASDTPTKTDTSPPPFATVAAAQAAEPGVLEPEDYVLLTTGASGLPFTPEVGGLRNPDTRILNVTNLPNGPYQQTAKDAQGHGLQYDAYTEDTIHRFYQMWQQSDCSVQNATRENPTGCLRDLLPFVITTFAGTTEEGMGTSMSFFNMQQGDAPVLNRLALEYSLADNYHQAVMGGTGANHIMIGTGDVYFFNQTFLQDGVAPLNFSPAPPPAVPGVFLGLPAGSPSIPGVLVANPDPVPGTNNVYKNDIAATLGEYVNCSDPTQPGVPAITSYLATLPYKASPNCAPNTFYAINNFFPGYHPDGTPANPLSPKQAADGSDFFFIPPQNVPTIGDALIAKNVSWVYYGGGFNAAVAGQPNAFCPICNPMQYAASIYGNKALVQQHTKDMINFFSDVANDTLPSVAFVKPSGFDDGHPQSSKYDLFEALLDNIVDQVKANKELFAETAIIVTWDESGGFYDSGFIQPVDFFGDGPRVPLLVISPFSRGGNVVHTYYDHVSITKFIERNWELKPLSARSRDNLPNPIQGDRDDDDNRYVPRNMPAIGDLMEMFHFGDRDDHGDHDHHDHDG